MVRRLTSVSFLAACLTATAHAQSPIVPSQIENVTSSSNDQGGFLLAPVDAVRTESTRMAPIPSQDIRTVRADIPDDLPKPAKLAGVRTPAGERGFSSSNEAIERSSKAPQLTQTDPGDLFIRTRKTDRDSNDEPRSRRSTIDSDEKISDRDRRRESNRLRDMFDGGSGLFRSDDCFANMISPVTNPFLFEDPRSVTEIRPTFMFQKIPNGQPEFRGGNIWYFGASARLAINERWSVTLNEFGAVSVNPGSGSAIDSKFGLGELHVGPKWTFYRDTQTETLAAAGVIFQIPIGNSSVFQDTGRLSIVPYVSAAQTLWDSRIGNFNGVATGGYSFSVNKERSDYLYLSGNLNLDVGNAHKFYPLVEAHWFYTTTNGQARPAFGFEGRDIINFGGNSKGSNLFTTAVGARYKISERAQIGAAYEMPVFGNRDLFRYRFTVDFILRF